MTNGESPRALMAVVPRLYELALIDLEGTACASHKHIYLSLVIYNSAAAATTSVEMRGGQAIWFQIGQVQCSEIILRCRTGVVIILTRHASASLTNYVRI